MKTRAIVFDSPMRLRLARLPLDDAGAEDIVVEVRCSGISTGTERLLWSGRMPHFPGMGYPLVPGYESVGKVVHAGRQSGMTEGQTVFVPGARCYGQVRGLFGGAASHVMLPAARTIVLPDIPAEQGVLLALAATAYHVTSGNADAQPDLIVGHGVLGRLLARLAVALSHSAGSATGAGSALLPAAVPTVWETRQTRRTGSFPYPVIAPDDDPRRNYRRIVDVSGDSRLLDSLIDRLAPGGEVVLAGFYEAPLSFVFPPAFMREARIRVAAQWQPADLLAVRDLVEAGRLQLGGLITHRAAVTDADPAYRTAFGDPECLKMLLDWRNCS